MAHVYGSVHQERGLLTAEGKTIKNEGEMLALLEAFWLPVKVAIIHCCGHQKGTLEIAGGNRLADKATRLPGPPLLTPCSCATLCTPDVPRYTLRTNKVRPNARKLQKRWMVANHQDLDHLIQEFAKRLIHQIHPTLHRGRQR